MVEELLQEEQRLGSFLNTPVIARDESSDSTFIASSEPQINFFETGRFASGDVIADRFEVVCFIARGGMGEVYEVKDRFLQGVNVALKIIRPEIANDLGSARRFEQEVILARKVTHPNLCPIYDMSRCEQPAPAFFFLTMKLLQGVTLDVHLKQSGKLAGAAAVEVCRQLVNGVAALHDGGLIHRDLKPNNIMLDSADAQGKVHVSIMDFGLARLHQLEGVGGPSVTIAGTLGYMAPELLKGQPPSQASDLFALGIVLHQVLAGERPTDSGKDLSLIPVPALRSFDVPPALVQGVEGLLSADPKKRLQAFSQLRAAETGIGTASTGFRVLTAKRPWYLLIATCAVLALGLAVRLTAPPAPQPLLSQQITFSPEPKMRPLRSDGTRLYFQSRGLPVAMAQSGGPILPIRSMAQDMQVEDVSADGTKFLLLKPDEEAMQAVSGTMWVASTLGGAPRQLSALHGQDARWFPDGQSILFADGGAIFSATEDGSNRKKLWQGDGIIDSLGFSPDARQVTFAMITKKNSLEWRMHADGTGAHVLLPDWPATSDQWFGQWTHDGRHFLFLSNKLGQGNLYEAVMPRWFEFWKKPSSVLVTGNQLDIQAIAPASDGTLFVIGAVDQGALQVLEPESGKYVPFLDGLSATSFTVSPDHQWMAYSDFPAGNLWKSRLDGSDAIQLTNTPAFMQVWSPDSKTIAYSDSKMIYTISADGGVPEKLTPAGDDAILPSWLPDGKSIAFSHWDGMTMNGRGAYVVDVATHNVSLMPGAKNYFAPTWSPDGKYCVAMADNPSRMMLYSAASGAWTGLHTFDTPFGNWSWANDSKSLYFRLMVGQSGIFQLTVPDGKWKKLSGLDGLNLRVYDSVPSLTVDGRIVIMSHTGVAQVYALQWPH